MEHEISLQALKEQMVDIETNITSTTDAVDILHCYMDRVGIPIPNMTENVASSIIFFDVTISLLSRCTSLDLLNRMLTYLGSRRIPHFLRNQMRMKLRLGSHNVTLLCKPDPSAPSCFNFFFF